MDTQVKSLAPLKLMAKFLLMSAGPSFDSHFTNQGTLPPFFFAIGVQHTFGAYLLLPPAICHEKHVCTDKVLLGDAESWADKDHAVASCRGGHTPQQANGVRGYQISI